MRTTSVHVRTFDIIDHRLHDISVCSLLTFRADPIYDFDYFEGNSNCSTYIYNRNTWRKLPTLSPANMCHIQSVPSRDMNPEPRSHSGNRTDRSRLKWAGKCATFLLLEIQTLETIHVLSIANLSKLYISILFYWSASLESLIRNIVCVREIEREQTHVACKPFLLFLFQRSCSSFLFGQRKHDFGQRTEMRKKERQKHKIEKRERNKRRVQDPCSSQG